MPRATWLHAVTLIDTTAKTLEVVDLPAGVEYTFRDVARTTRTS